MKILRTVSLRAILSGMFSLAFIVPSASAGSVHITSPQQRSTFSGVVTIAASANESSPFHLEVWDDGHKLGNFFSNSIRISPVFARGMHNLTIEAVSSNGKIFDSSNVSFNVISVSPVPLPPLPLPPVTAPPVGLPPVDPTPVPPTQPPTVVPSDPSSSYVTITSPTSGSTSINAVNIAASANIAATAHLLIWDNGLKLGQVDATSVSGVYVLPSGTHVLTVQAIDKTGALVNSSSVNYTVAENCTTGRYSQCDLDQVPADNTQNDCNPAQELKWVGNGCGSGVQGVNPTFPLSTLVEPTAEGDALADQGNLSLNGHSLHLGETQAGFPSNVLFRGQSPTTTPADTIDTHWTMDEYVYLPDPTAHQALELDTQYTAGGIWTKFYTECAFNMKNATGYWAVFDSETGGWIFLNGQVQNGQVPPVVPCNRNQFSQPWAGSSNPSFTGWHHIAWTFLRDPDGTVTFQTVTFDGTTTQVNFKPNSASGGQVQDNGNFSALVQLDGIVDLDRKHDTVDAYMNEITLTHTP